MTRLLPLLLSPLLAGPLGAQANTDIFLVRLVPSADGPRIGSVVVAAGGPGYENQPYFTPDGSAFLYTAAQTDGQTDIFRFGLPSSEARVTATKESEYSPTPLPDGSGFSVIRVEADSAQRLWAFDWSGARPRLLLANVRPVGYQAWIDDNRVALFVLGQPPTLQIADLRTGRATTVDESIGRSLHRIPGDGAISYVRKRSDDDWEIRRLDPQAGTSVALIATRPGSEDYAWSPNGEILMGQGSILYRWRPGMADWASVGDLGPYGVQGISRLAVDPSGEWLAIVGNGG